MATYVNDSLGNSIAASGYYEFEELEEVRRFLEAKQLFNSDSVFLDIGANIGNHALYFRNDFSSIHCFEVNPRTQRLLEFNVNAFSNICVHKFGLADFNGYVEIVENDTNFGGTKIQGASSNRSEIEVKMLDQVFTDKQRVGVIKMDVEGYEINVLRGAESTIMKNKPVVLFELHKEDFHSEAPEVVVWLKNRGYEFYARKPSKIRLLSKLIWLLTGNTKRFHKVLKLKPSFYSMIIALPNGRI